MQPRRAAPRAMGSREEGSSGPDLTALTTYRGACRSVKAFEKRNRLGEGTYGTVYRAIAEDGCTVALKKVRWHSAKDGWSRAALREIRLLRSLAHAAVVKLREVVVGDELGAVFLVFEYVEHDLASLLTHGHPFSTAEVKGVCAQLCEGLAYLPKFGLLSNYIHVTV